ncbi:MAG: Asp23/Gls24 family envelope stress response protein [Actinomycetota bacterium]|nr:Asp23/Gls24 family envelope stress response protein [Actinomycetota bacterium]
MGAVEVSPVAVARAAAAAAMRTPEVVDLHSGVAGEFATYGGGQRVAGVRLRRREPPVRLEVRVMARYGRPLHEVAAEVRDNVLADLSETLPDEPPATVDVRVADLVFPASGDES